MTECDARLREGCCWGGREEGERDVGRTTLEWREGPGIDGSGIWRESIVVVVVQRKRRCSPWTRLNSSSRDLPITIAFLLQRKTCSELAPRTNAKLLSIIKNDISTSLLSPVCLPPHASKDSTCGVLHLVEHLRVSRQRRHASLHFCRDHKGASK